MFKCEGIKNKLESKSGNAMTLAIFLSIMVSVFAIFILKLTSNQMKSTMNNQEWMQSKYVSEAGAEQIIANAISSIHVVKDQDNKYRVTFNSTVAEITDNIELNNQILIENKSSGKMQLKEGKVNQLSLTINSDSFKKSNNRQLYKLDATISIGVNITDENNYDITYSIDKWEKE